MMLGGDTLGTYSKKKNIFYGYLKVDQFKINTVNPDFSNVRGTRNREFEVTGVQLQ